MICVGEVRNKAGHCETQVQVRECSKRKSREIGNCHQRARRKSLATDLHGKQRNEHSKKKPKGCDFEEKQKTGF